MPSDFEPTHHDAWQQLEAFARRPPTVQEAMEDRSWIAQAKRSTQGLHLDLSHHQINVPIWNSLTALLAASPFEELRQGMFSGDRINLTENRAVGHTRIRTPEHLMSDPTLASIRQFSDGVRSGQLQGATGKPFETIINIGISS